MTGKPRHDSATKHVEAWGPRFLSVLSALRVVSWNDQGDFLHRRYRHCSVVKWMYFRGVFEAADVLALRETHGLGADVHTPA